MGGIKNQMMEEQDNLRLATDYLVQIKQLEHCEGHGEVWGGGFFKLEGDFWPKVMGDRKRGIAGLSLGPQIWTLVSSPTFSRKHTTATLATVVDTAPGSLLGIIDFPPGNRVRPLRLLCPDRVGRTSSPSRAHR